MAAPISLYPHQKQAIGKLRSGSILCGGVGSGKSRTALYFYYVNICHGHIVNGRISGHMDSPVDLYIITTARKRDTKDWEEEMLPFLLTTNPDILPWDQVKVHVDSWNNLHKYKEIKDAFFIFDEQRIVGSGAWVKAFLKIAKSNQWILLSATPGDTWMDYIPVFIANGFYKNRTQFLKEHAVYNRYTKYPKIDRFVNCQKLEIFRKQILVEMPFQRETVRHYIDIPVDYDHNLYDLIKNDRWDIYHQAPITDISNACIVMRKLVNLDPSRCEELLKLIMERRKAIVFYNYDFELVELRSVLLDNRIPWTEWNGHRHDSILAEEDTWVYLVQYTAGAEGWNCTSTDTVIFYSLNYSYKVMEQSCGRIDRINTPFRDLYYYRFISASSIDKAIMRALKNKKTFNEKAFMSE